ncbi:hypothetical protein Tco_0317273 [Tanacetum coccineum]
MEDEHLDTILATESDELIKSSVENLVQILSESEGIPDNMCDVPFRDNSPPLDISKDQFEGFSDSNDDSTSIDDDSFSIEDIDYVEASPPILSSSQHLNLNLKGKWPAPLLDGLILPDYEAFFCDSEPDSGNFTMDVVEDISDNPTRELYVHVLHDLPTHPTLQLDLDFTLSKSPIVAILLWMWIARIFEASRARGFVLQSQELQILSFILGIQYPNLID